MYQNIVEKSYQSDVLRSPAITLEITIISVGHWIKTPQLSPSQASTLTCLYPTKGLLLNSSPHIFNKHMLTNI